MRIRVGLSVFTRTLGLTCLLGAVAPCSWSQVPLTDEFQVNTFTTNFQNRPAVATDSAGNFVVAWDSYTQDGDKGGVFARRYLASGTPLGSSEFRVNAYTTGSQGGSSVASDAAGHLVIVWESVQESVAGIFARRLNPDGSAGPEFHVNTYTTNAQVSPRVAMDDAGDFVVAWQSNGQDGNDYGIFAQRFDAGGLAQGSEFRVNSYTTGRQSDAAVAMGPSGEFSVVWTSDGQDGSEGGIVGRRYDASGVPQGVEFRVNTYTTHRQQYPSIAVARTGDFVVVWSSYNQSGPGSGYSIRGQRYDVAGSPLGQEFQVNQDTAPPTTHPTVAVDSAGSFVVAWHDDFGNNFDAYGVSARAFDASGTPQGGQFQVTANTTNYVNHANALAFQSAGRFVIAWHQLSGAGSFDVFARRFATDLVFKDGFESGTLSSWSASAIDGGDLATSFLGAMKSTSLGLQGTVNDTNSLFVQDDTPIDEDRYRARFYIDTNGFDPGESQGHLRTRVFLVLEEAPTRRLAAVVLKRQGGAYSIEGRCRLDGGAQADTGFFTISDGPHAIEIDWKRSSSAVAHDGTFEFWIDGVPQSQLTGLSNSVSSVDFARLGALSLKGGANGTLYWDEFESRRISFIGP